MIPGLGTKITPAVWHSKKKKEIKKIFSPTQQNSWTYGKMRHETYLAKKKKKKRKRNIPSR